MSNDHQCRFFAVFLPKVVSNVSLAFPLQKQTAYAAEPRYFLPGSPFFTLIFANSRSKSGSLHSIFYSFSNLLADNGWQGNLIVMLSLQDKFWGDMRLSHGDNCPRPGQLDLIVMQSPQDKFWGDIGLSHGDN